MCNEGITLKIKYEEKHKQFITRRMLSNLVKAITNVKQLVEMKRSLCLSVSDIVINGREMGMSHQSAINNICNKNRILNESNMECSKPDQELRLFLTLFPRLINTGT
eukprot:TRINITY_DN3887_c1_g4_i1.p1 TRINITY_DN3887_c1_g4~~TRINITY_DN3887_c1_g4_i1.p1  ORF type:complete len:107 (-),score=3.02 TRINITY_DN3887_c1_g4_i1:92-412(-)